MFLTFRRLFKQHAKWSSATFGRTTPEPSIHHLKEEVNELLLAPYDDEEYADCLLLLIDAYRTKGGTARSLLKVSFRKLKKCKNRKWQEPNELGYSSHVK